MPRISIIIPVYNTAEYLPKCLDSIYTQSMEDFQVILVNDGSPDDSQVIIDRYAAQYPDKTITLRQENAGQAAARNAGLRLATGEFICFVDSDDYLHPNALEQAYRAVEEGGLDIVCYQFFRVENGRSIPPGRPVFPCEDIRKTFILTEAMPCNKLIRRTLFTEHGLYFSQGRIYEDLELMPQLALYTDKIGYLDVPLYYYLIRSGSTMQQLRYSPKLASIYPVMDTLYSKFRHTPFLREVEHLHIVHLLHDAVLRFIRFPEGDSDIRRIRGIMRERFPHWQHNPYYRSAGRKYKAICTLAYYGQIRLLRFLLNANSRMHTSKGSE